MDVEVKESIKSLFGIGESPADPSDLDEKTWRAQRSIAVLQLGVTGIPAAALGGVLLSGQLHQLTGAQQVAIAALAGGGVGASAALEYASRKIDGLLVSDDGIGTDSDDEGDSL
jgi:hypothetical protein